MEIQKTCGPYTWSSLYQGEPTPRGGAVFRQGESRYHFPHVIRAQTEAPAFARDLAALKVMYPGASWYAYVSGPEKGIVDFINTNYGLRIQVLPINGDKLVRAQPASAAWNAGEISVPEGAEWVGDFASEVMDFTGVHDSHDDQVDALAAAYDGLTKPVEWWKEFSAFRFGQDDKAT